MAKLLEVLHELVDQGNSVVVIEHNIEVIKTADWVTATAPARRRRRRPHRGRGTPEDIANSAASHTGRFLREVLARRPKKKAKEKVIRAAAE